MKQLLRRHMPTSHKIRNYRLLRIFGETIHHADLWRLNRRSVSGAFALGLFMAWVPLPLQMILVAACAIPLRVNLPISLGLVWITNPFTMPPLFWFAYTLGGWILDAPLQIIEFHFSLAWFSAELGAIWRPLLLGCFLCALFSAAVGYWVVRLCWGVGAAGRWKRRPGRGQWRPQARKTSLNAAKG